MSIIASQGQPFNVVYSDRSFNGAQKLVFSVAEDPSNPSLPTIQLGALGVALDLVGDVTLNGSAIGGGAASQIVETSGPDTLDIDAIADGQFLKRSGSTVVGIDNPGFSTDAGMTAGVNPAGSGNVMIGLPGSTLASVSGSIFLGYQDAHGDNSICLLASSSGIGGVAGGSVSCIAIGERAQVGSNSHSSIAIGNRARVGGNATKCIAMGYDINLGTDQTNVIAVGDQAAATGDNAISMGLQATTGEDGIAMGRNVVGRAASVTIGADAVANGTASVMVGNGGAAGSRGTAVGAGAGAGDNGTALGWATGAGVSAIAIGRSAQANDFEAVIGSTAPDGAITNFQARGETGDFFKVTNDTTQIGANNKAGMWLMHRDNSGVVTLKQVLVDSVTGVLSVTP